MIWIRVAGCRREAPHARGVVFGERVFDRHDRVAPDPGQQQLAHAVGVELPALQPEPVSSFASELRRGDVERDADVLQGPVAGAFDGAHHHRQRLFVRIERGPESPLVRDAVERAGLGHELARSAIDLRGHDQRFVKTVRPERHDHEVLDVRASSGVRAAAEDLHFRQRQADAAGLREVRVQRHAVRGGGRVQHRHRGRDHGVSAEPRFGRGAIERDQIPVDRRLVECVAPDQPA